MHHRPSDYDVNASENIYSPTLTLRAGLHQPLAQFLSQNWRRPKKQSSRQSSPVKPPGWPAWSHKHTVGASVIAHCLLRY